MTRKEIQEEAKAETLRIPDEVTPERKQQVVDAVWVSSIGSVQAATHHTDTI